MSPIRGATILARSDKIKGVSNINIEKKIKGSPEIIVAHQLFCEHSLVLVPKWQLSVINYYDDIPAACWTIKWQSHVRNSITRRPTLFHSGKCFDYAKINETASVPKEQYIWMNVHYRYSIVQPDLALPVDLMIGADHYVLMLCDGSDEFTKFNRSQIGVDFKFSGPDLGFSGPWANV